MTKVTDALTSKSGDPVFICDFTAPRGADPDLLDGARHLEADFVSVAYNPGKLVRVDSVSAAYEIRQRFDRDVIFNLSPRDMNRLALESRLLGAQLLGLENVLVIQGDSLTERDAAPAVSDYNATGLMAAIANLNHGLDYRGSKLRSSCDFCIGASLDLSRGPVHEARLAHRKVEAGADFFVSQPVFDIRLMEEFLEAYEGIAGDVLHKPVFWGLQILTSNGVLFSSVPPDLIRDLENGRDGVDIALELFALFREIDIRSIYLVAPILRGGARDYEAAGRFLSETHHETPT
jgi:methionine synthase / methylenetetrahydrofolate reductase(NADPH)